MIHANKDSARTRTLVSINSRQPAAGEGIYGRTLGIGLGFEANVHKKIKARKLFKSHWPSGVT